MKEFPRVYLPKGEVHIYGYPHGMGKGFSLNKEVRRKLEMQIKNFGRRDYVLVESYDKSYMDPFLSKLGVPQDEIVRLEDYGESSLFADFPHLKSIAERPEWYYNFIHKSEPHRKILEYFEKLKEEGAIEFRKELDEISTIRGDLKELERLKESLISNIQKNVDGVSLEDVESYMEGETTFPSLLLARTSFYRASAYGGRVRLFCGFWHPSEIKRFLDKNKLREDYVSNLATQNMKEIYEENEMIQQSITQLFTEHSHRFDPILAPLFLKWLAHKEYEGCLGKLLEGKTSINLVINLDEFIEKIHPKKETY